MPDTPVPRSEAEILADPRLREWLESYSPSLHELFLKNYARVLQELHNHGALYESNMEYLLHKYDKAAYEHMWLIQHQKLFDLECQWRAGQTTVPEARLTTDFQRWHNHIEVCPVVSPISPEEIELFDSFLAQLDNPDQLSVTDLSEDFWHDRCMKYWRAERKRLAEDRDDEDDRGDDEDEDEIELPEFTQYWDLHRGTGYLRQLPDLRGELEARYERAGRAERKRLDPPDPPRSTDPRPSVPTFGPEFEVLVRELLRRHEPAVWLRQYETKLQLKDYDATDGTLDLPMALERLQEAGPGLIPIKAHADWRQAILEAANRHYLDQLRAALPTVYEDYCQRQALGIRHAFYKEQYRDFDSDRSRHHWYEDLLREGRRALGEPDDLDF